MNSSNLLRFGPRQLWTATWLIVVIWTLAAAASTLWNVPLLRQAMFGGFGPP